MKAVAARDAAKALGIPQERLLRDARAGLVPSILENGHYFFYVDAVRAAIDLQERHEAIAEAKVERNFSNSKKGSPGRRRRGNRGRGSPEQTHG